MAGIAKIKQNRHFDKVKRWSGLLSITGGGQLIVQLTGMATGLALVNFMSKREMAIYTAANSMFSVMTVLADGGISSGVMAQGGKVWQDKVALGKIMSTGMMMRRQFALYSLLCTLPILIYMLYKRDAVWWEMLLVIVALIPSFTSAISDSLMAIVPKLHQDMGFLQKNQVVVNILRLVLTCGLVYFVPFTVVALLCSGLPRVYGNISLRKFIKKHATITNNSDPEVKKDIMLVVKKILPGSIYYSISGQLSVWLISFFGSTDSVADLGALTRFSVLLTILTSVFGMLAIPRFAKLEDNKNKIGKFFITSVGGLVGVGLLTIAFFYLFSEQLLWLLGNKYGMLSEELVLTIIAAVLSTLSGAVFGLCASRGKPTHAALIIVGNISAVIIGCLLFNVKDLKGVLYFNIFASSFPLLFHTINFYYKVYLKSNE